MASFQVQLDRIRSVRDRISVMEVIAILAAILSLLTLTVLIPGGLHLP